MITSFLLTLYYLFKSDREKRRGIITRKFNLIRWDTDEQIEANLIVLVKETKNLGNGFSEIKILKISGCPRGYYTSVKETIGTLRETNSINWIENKRKKPAEVRHLKLIK